MLHSRSSGEESSADAGSINLDPENGRRSRRASSPGPGVDSEGVSLAAFRKRQRVDHVVGETTASSPPRLSPRASEWAQPGFDRRGSGAFDAAPVPQGVVRRTSSGLGSSLAFEQSERERALRLSATSSSNHVGIATSDLRSSARPSLPEVYDTATSGG